MVKQILSQLKLNINYHMFSSWFDGHVDISLQSRNYMYSVYIYMYHVHHVFVT